MPRPKRNALNGVVYHVLNRSNGRMPLFESPGDYRAFLSVLAEAHARVPMRTLAYSVMPNHWHLVLWPAEGRLLSEFMHWMTTTHTQRWLTAHGMVGFGHIYRGRYKSFPVESNEYYLTVSRYVVANPLRAGLVQRAEDWPWSSLYPAASAPDVVRPPIVPGPVGLPEKWLAVVNTGQPRRQLDEIRNCAARGCPYGRSPWVIRTAAALHIESTLRPRGRPRLPH